MNRLIEFAFDPAKLESLASEHREAYLRAVPFSHIVLDGLFSEEVLDRICEEFPKPGEVNWTLRYHDNSKKLEFSSENRMGESAWRFIAQLNSSTFVSFLEKLTGIDGLIPDPHLWGGGLHQIERGGYLNIHADFNWHEKLKLDRRLNLLIYLNKDWKEEYGGHLELWNRDLSRCEKKCLPLFNRCVIFSTTDYSYHGHPVPLTSPEGVTRKSIALYYYSRGRPAHEVSRPHSTLYRKKRPSFLSFFASKTQRQKGSKEVSGGPSGG